METFENRFGEILRTGLLGLNLSNIIKTMIPMQWFSLCCYVWIEAQVGLLTRLQQEIFEQLWTGEKTSCLQPFTPTEKQAVTDESEPSE